MLKTIIGCFLLFLATGISYAQDETSKQEIIELSKTKWQWMADKEADKLAELFDEKAVFVHMGG